MILRRLLLDNFRQYGKLDLPFQDGITGIVGRNGSGKSTILEAILWCLFGVRAARTSKEGIKRQAAAPADLCKVKLEFELNGRIFELTRSLIGKSLRSEARLEQQGSLDAVSTREVDDYIVRLIGLDLKGFLSSFFARQRELNALFDARPADRKDHLAQMLGVGRLDNAILALKDDLKATRQKIDILTDLKIDPEKIKNDLSEKKATRENIAADKQNSEKILGQMEVELTDQEGSLENLRQLEQNYNLLEKKSSALSARKTAGQVQITRLKTELTELSKISENLEALKVRTEGISALQSQIANLQKAELQVQEKNRLENEKTALTRRISDLQLTQKKSETRISQLEKNLIDKNKVEKSISELEKRREKLRDEYSETKSAAGIVADNLAELEKQKGEIEQLGPEATCHACLRPFGDDYAEIEKHFDEEIQSKTQQLEPMSKRLAEIKGEGKTVADELDQAVKRMEAMASNENELASTKASLAITIGSLSENENRLKADEKRLAELGRIQFDPDKLDNLDRELSEKLKKREEYIRLAERAARFPELEKELAKTGKDQDEIETALNEHKAEIAVLDFDPDAYKNAQDKLTQIRKSAFDLRLEIERADGQMKLMQSEIGVLADRLEEYDQSRKEIIRLREELTYKEKLSLLFAEFRVYLIGRIRPALSRQTSDLFYEMTGGRYQEVILDDDYSLRLFDRGESFPVNRFSGGEIDLVNLCFRLAISLEMASTAGIDHSFIILDEIFGSQDSQRQQMIIDGLGRLKNRFRQIIIISHIDEVKEMAENIINVELDSSGLSHATTVRVT